MKLPPVKFIVLLVVWSAPLTAVADYTEVTSRPALGATDSIGWGVLGPEYTYVHDTFSIMTNGGISLTVTQPMNDPDSAFQRLDQGSGWNGDFPNGEQLLWNQGFGPTMTLNFGANLISAGGASIEGDYLGLYVARITALDSMGKILASFTESGERGEIGIANGNVVFLGISSTTASISQIQFSLDVEAGYPPTDFAIDSFSFAGPASVPEPSSILLLGIGLIGALAVSPLRRRRSTSTTT